MKIFTAGMPELCQIITSKLKNPIVFEYNFEQIIGLAKSKELEKLCIYIDVWNCYGKKFNGMRGQGAAEKIHELNSKIPILIWDGREFVSDLPEIPQAFQTTGKICPIKNSNELYLSSEFYDDKSIINITIKFFEGTLILNDVPNREQLTL